MENDIFSLKWTVKAAHYTEREVQKGKGGLGGDGGSLQQTTPTSAISSTAFKLSSSLIK